MTRYNIKSSSDKGYHHHDYSPMSADVPVWLVVDKIGQLAEVSPWLTPFKNFIVLSVYIKYNIVAIL